MSQSSETRPTRVEIDLPALRYNFKSCRAFVGDRIQYLAVVKADAYGHGAIECARALAAEGVDWFGVALPEEGLKLRKAGITKPILCLGGFWIGQEDLILEYRLSPVIYQFDKAAALSKRAAALGFVAPIHIKIDTGMGRIGVRYDEVDEFVPKLKDLSNLRLEGLMTHFAAADDLRENSFTGQQIERFRGAAQIFEAHGFRPEYLDMANSPGAVAHPAARGNLVRIGGLLYGLVEDVLPIDSPRPKLKPILSLYSRIAHLKSVPAGESLGYGRSFVTDRDSLIATVPIGYADGYPRALSNRGRVLINGAFAPIAGRVSMDWTIVDVTGIPEVKVGDEVILIGERGGKRITSEEIAKLSGTISYEITCGISPRVPRKYVAGE